MSDNIIKFRRPDPVKPPREPLSKRISPAMKRLLIWLGVALAFVAVYGYFHLTGGSPVG
jgi:hypothetical protein